jgi:zinc and cadmium transporter
MSIFYEEQNFNDYSIRYENLTHKNQETPDYWGGLLIECGFWGRLMANNPGIQSGQHAFSSITVKEGDLKTTMWSTIIFSCLAGLVTIWGILITRMWRRSSLRYSHYINSFAAGIILTTALMELLPRGLTYNEDAPLYAIGGFVAFLILETFLVVHSGAEVHYVGRRGAAKGVVFFWGLFLHSLLDGVIIAIGFATDYRVGLLTALAVISHEFPEGITTFSLLLQNLSDRKAIVLAVMVALATPAGGLIGLAVLPAPESVLGAATGLVVGSFVYIAATDIVPEIREEKAIQNTVALAAGSLFLIVMHHFLAH